MDLPKLFLLPPELLAKISFYCFKDFRSTCKLLKEVAFPWNVLAKTQANCLILGANFLNTSHLINPYPLQLDWDIGKYSKAFYFACQTGNLEIFNFCKRLGMPFGCLASHKGLVYACKYGHLEIAKLAIELGANCFEVGLKYACMGGHLELAKLAVESGAINFHFGLKYACRNGKLPLAKFCVDKFIEYSNLIKLPKISSKYIYENSTWHVYKTICQEDLDKFCKNENCSLELANFCKNSSARHFNHNIEKFSRYFASKNIFNEGLINAYKDEHLELIQFCNDYNASNKHSVHFSPIDSVILQKMCRNRVV